MDGRCPRHQPSILGWWAHRIGLLDQYGSPTKCKKVGSCDIYTESKNNLQIIIAYLWNSVLSVLLILVWIKLEIIGEKFYQEFEYQKLINIETTKELTGLIKEVKGLKVRRNTPNISSRNFN